MAKVNKVKWALGGDEPGDLEEFLTNDDIIKKNGLPSKGTYTFAVKRLAVKPNKNGDDRISVMLIMKEPKNKSAKWNGYMIWDGLNVTEQSAPFIKRFLKALGLTWADFMQRSKRDDQDPPHIVQIGKVKFEAGKDPVVRALVKISPADDYNDDAHLEIQRYLPLDDDVFEDDEEEEDDVEEDVDDDDDDEPEEGDEEDDDDEDEEDEEEEDEEEEDDDEEADEDDIEELTEELAELKLALLRKRVLANDEDAEIEGLKRKDLVQMILEQELNVPPF